MEEKDFESLERELKRLARERETRARAAIPKLKALLASRPTYHDRSRGHKRFLVLLEPWQADAIAILLEILGGTFQDRVRTWLTAAILAEAKGLR